MVFNYPPIPSFVCNIRFDILNNESFQRNFSNFMVIAILSSGMLVGIEMYFEHYDSQSTQDIFLALNCAVLAAFILEWLLNAFIYDHNPMNFLFGKNWKWSWFDTLVIILSLPIPLWSFLFGQDSATFLRLVRLARIAKIFRKVKQLAMILDGLFGGLVSMLYVFGFLSLLVFIYGLAGATLFKTEDPFHFSDFKTIFVTLFRCMVMDSWSTIFYINYVGCDSYLNSVYVQESDRTPYNRIFWCTNPNPQPAAASLYFLSYVVIIVFVVLSIFISVITVNMEESADKLKKEAEDLFRQKQVEKRAFIIKTTKAKLARTLQKINKRNSNSDAAVSNHPTMYNTSLAIMKSQTGQQDHLEIKLSDSNRSYNESFDHINKDSSHENKEGKIKTNSFSSRSMTSQPNPNSTHHIEGDRNRNTRSSNYSHLFRRIMQRSMSKQYQVDSSDGHMSSSAQRNRNMKVLPASALFEGYLGDDSGTSHDNQGVRRGSFAPEVGSNTAQISGRKSSRGQREGSSVSVSSGGRNKDEALRRLKTRLESIRHSRLNMTGATSVKDREMNTETIHNHLLGQLTGTTASEESDMNVVSADMLFSRQSTGQELTANSPTPQAMPPPTTAAQLYSDLIGKECPKDDLLRSQMEEHKDEDEKVGDEEKDGKDSKLDKVTVDDDPPQQRNLIRPVCGFRCVNFYELNSKVIERIQRWEAKQNIIQMKYLLRQALGLNSMTGSAQLERRTCLTSYQYLGFYIHLIVSSKAFEWTIIASILLASILVGLMCDYRVEPHHQVMDVLEGLDLLVQIIFTIEIVFKIIVKGFAPWMYFYSNWNKLDFIVVIGSYASNPEYFQEIRLLRILRILKLISSLPRLKSIVGTFFVGMRSLLYIGIILLIFFYISAILGVIIFRSNDPWHFDTVHQAMLSLFRTATQDNWSEVVYINYYGCDLYPGIYNDFATQCTKPHGNKALAATFFIIFTMISAYVMLTLFVAVIITSMNESLKLRIEETKHMEELSLVQELYHISDHQLKAFREVFDMLNVNQNETIERDEMQLGLLVIREELPNRNIDAMQALEGIEHVDFISFVKMICNLVYKDMD